MTTYLSEARSERKFYWCTIITLLRKKQKGHFFIGRDALSSMMERIMDLFQGNLATYNLIHAIWIGQCAFRLMASGGTGLILGATNKGLFIEIQPGEVIFISGDAYRGPITINLETRLNYKALFSVGETCQLLKDRLISKEFQILINHDTSIWDPPPISFAKDGLQKAIQRGIDLAGQLIKPYQGGQFYALLDWLVSHSGELSKDRIADMIPGIKDEGDHFARFSGLLGLGRGLTPAGDDFLCGFLLASFYLRQNAVLKENQSNLIHPVAAEAQQKTTSLSAALIQRAALGEGDERLLDALRWIAQGDRDIAHARESLLSYGSSSGVDALAGMLTALFLLDFEQL
jgi:hypothetical protein